MVRMPSAALKRITEYEFGSATSRKSVTSKRGTSLIRTRGHARRTNRGGVMIRMPFVVLGLLAAGLGGSTLKYIATRLNVCYERPKNPEQVTTDTNYYEPAPS